MNPVWSILIGGILPFGAVFIELFFILTSIWLHQFYSIFGFLFIVFVILIITCAEITIVLCYFQLCSEDYLWWWRSYLTSLFTFLCTLPFLICCFSLFLQKTWDHKASIRSLVFWVHAAAFIRFLCVDWYDWFLRMLLVHKAHLFISENWLNPANFKFVR